MFYNLLSPLWLEFRLFPVFFIISHSPMHIHVNICAHSLLHLHLKMHLVVATKWLAEHLERNRL